MSRPFRIRRAVCAVIGHDWSPWKQDRNRDGLVYQWRACKRCPSGETESLGYEHFGVHPYGDPIKTAGGHAGKPWVR